MDQKKEFLQPNSATWIFAISMIGFILLKIPYLSIPFFWDESGVYGKMIFELTDQGLSLHPKAINEWISRGHPLLYPNLIAAACHLFGANVTVAHAANLALTCCLLVSMYFHLKKFFDPWVGLMACVILMALPIFFAQSVFVLPEIALALMLWWTTWAFIEKKYLIFFLAGTCACLTKEPAIVWIGSLFLWDILFERKQVSFKTFLWLTPLIPFAIFLFIQKNTFGWYLFPYHTGGFDLRLSSMAEKIGMFGAFLFWKQGRMLWGLILIAGFILSILSKKQEGEWNAVSYRKRLYASIFASCIYILFSSTTFYGDRYILAVLPYFTSLIGIICIHSIFRRRYIVALLFTGVLVAISCMYMSSKEFNYDNDISYVRSVNSSKKTINYMLDRNMLVQDEFTATMPLIFALADSRFGYLPADTLARHSKAIHKGTKYAVQVTPGTPVENPNQFPLDTIDMWYDQDIRTIVYRVMPKDTVSE